ncbi:MAG: hypothetical protein AAB402_03020 [Patescibacteria group bacterium]
MLELLRDLQVRKRDYLKAETGAHFEDQIQNQLLEKYTRIFKRDIDSDNFKLLKENISKKEDVGFFKFKTYPQRFVKTLFGSQSYPDFIVFSGRFAVPVEIKYSKKKQNKPVWNSGLPRPNGLYIFGSYENQDVTFFLGSDVLSVGRRRLIIQFFEDVKSDEAKFKRVTLKSAPDLERRGFAPYIRRAYDQHQVGEAVMSYFAHPDRQRVEAHAIEVIASLM